MSKTPVVLDGKTILVTGSPGFIGAWLVIRLLKELNGGTVVSFDSMNDYYEVSLKQWRLKQIEEAASHSPVRHVFIRGNLADRAIVRQTFETYRPGVVVNLAAQAGVRYSIDHPDAYIESNIIGFYNILEACRRYPVEHLVYASSSSVYGGNKKVPFSTEDMVDHPVSLYAATKKSTDPRGARICSITARQSASPPEKKSRFSTTAIVCGTLLTSTILSRESCA